MDQSIAASEQPRYIKLNERDNVAIVVNDFGLPAGTRFSCGLTLRAFVPQGHKTALVDVDEGVPIRTLQNLALNPNFGGEVLVVGLGCEKLAPERLVPEGINDSIVRMQDEAFVGFGAIIDAIMAQAEARLAILNKRQRETCPA